MTVFVYILILAVLVLHGAFFSGSETGVYRLSRFKLRVGAEQHASFYGLLSRTMEDTHALVLSILIGNNLANGMATSIVTLLLVDLVGSEKAAQLYVTLIMTPVLFVFSEVIPKNIYYFRADAIMPRLAPLLWFFHKIFTWCGAVKLLSVLSRLFTRMLGTPSGGETAARAVGRSYMRQIISETHEEGILSPIQTNIMHRLVSVPTVSVGMVMMPASKVVMVNVKSGRDELMKVLEKYSYSRYPVFEHGRNHVLGFINIYETLRNDEDFHNLHRFVHKMPSLPANTSVIQAMTAMREKDQRIAIVTSGNARKSKIVGIVTMRDLVEEITGEFAW
ncbi:magnesium/cobalt efflux protein CorC [Anaerohalosphaera lusitana]|uniref:Magnesium/cobalt efflux protein CorC n=1 Tax=Anaerohalosphaera lusitana TaxID=1936003 RepID=A0A1U9NMK6_9BACT|nr:CNNM domain-containing protein [Anaerohalosphaera lusitana]AQT69143.1 magnesium/cobalt efflux protein CorC [Anaerohalosphaera lusitana]